MLNGLGVTREGKNVCNEADAVFNSGEATVYMVHLGEDVPNWLYWCYTV